jgi:hypothetical protein
LKKTIANLEKLIESKEANFNLLCNLDRTKEIEALEKLSIERLIILEEKLDKLYDESIAFKIKSMAIDGLDPSFTEEEEISEGKELEEPEEEEESEDEEESEVTSEPQPTTKGIGLQTTKELESISAEGKALSETESKKEKRAENVSPEQTGVEVSHESFVSTGKTTEPSPESENVLKPDDDKQKSNTSPEAGTKKNEVEAPNRMSEFLWLMLIMSVIGAVFSFLWVLLN